MGFIESPVIGIVGLGFFWLASAGLSEALLGEQPNPGIVAMALTLALALAIVLLDLPLFETLLVAAGGTAGIVLFVVYLPLIKLLLNYTVWIPVTSLIKYLATVPQVTGVVGLGLAGIVWIGTLYVAWRTGPAVGWLLALRMVVSPLVLAVLLLGFLTAIWRFIDGLARFGMSLLGIPPEAQGPVTIILAVWLLVTFLYLELGRIGTVEHHGDATQVTSEEFPILHSITTRIALQFDVPVPSIAIVHRSEPEAITVGYRPGNVTLILSQGTLNALDDNQLEAVVAHELAHVANLDAMVTTLTSLPLLLADGLTSRLDAAGPDDQEGDDSETAQSGSDETGRSLLSSLFRIVTFIPRHVLAFFGLLYVVLPDRTKSPFVVIKYGLVLLAVLTKYVSRPIVSSLLRARETVADRTAATVTGSPATLASALRTLDDQISGTPSEDLRKASSLSSLSILPLDPVSFDDISLSDGVVPLMVAARTRISWVFFATHPPTSRRIEMLTALSEERQMES